SRLSNGDVEEGVERMSATSAAWCSERAARRVGVSRSSGSTVMVAPSRSAPLTPKHFSVSRGWRSVNGSSRAPAARIAANSGTASVGILPSRAPRRQLYKKALSRISGIAKAHRPLVRIGRQWRGERILTRSRWAERAAKKAAPRAVPKVARHGGKAYRPKSEVRSLAGRSWPGGGKSEVLRFREGLNKSCRGAPRE